MCGSTGQLRQPLAVHISIVKSKKSEYCRLGGFVVL
jgi:hypothetical protein